VADAVEAAGGLMPDAVAASVNLARTVTDGEQIVVPDADTASVSGNSASTGSGASANPAKQGAEMVDLNTADESALDALPGIGPATAARIIADREANGPFASAEDLGRVSGIGPKKLEQLSGLVCVR
jgi:competence protein ComEA